MNILKHILALPFILVLWLGIRPAKIEEPDIPNLFEKEPDGGPGESIFCPQCHQLVCRVKHTRYGTQVLRGSEVLMTFARNISVNKNGKKRKGFPLNCPNGHEVVVR